MVNLLQALLDASRNTRVADALVIGNTILLIVQNDSRERWLDTAELEAFVVSVLEKINLKARFRVEWAPAPRDESLFAPGTNVEVFCTFVADPSALEDPLMHENEVIHLAPDVLMGWCPGVVKDASGATVTVALIRKLVTITEDYRLHVGLGEVRVGRQSKYIRVR